MAKEAKPAKSKTVKAAFGAANRSRLIDLYFQDHRASSPGQAWRHVYQLLLWIDGTTGLAHCYESDKSQPGKHWYPRALAFHEWVSKQLRASPDGLADSLDWLFRRATLDLAKYLLEHQAAILAKAKGQRAPYEGRGFPKPGEDAELVSIVQSVLGDYFSAQPPEEKWRELVQRVRQHVTLENKRKNLVGEGFEDVLSSVVRRSASAALLDIGVRRLLQTVPGFEKERKGDKPNKVDVVILGTKNGRRTLVTAKWSIRADREKQFQAEFSNYVSAKSDLKPFDYVLVTNEFDPARLVRACEQTAANNYMFTDVVHISTDAVRATYGASPEDSMKKVIEYIDAGRLLSLGDWIAKLKT